MTARAASRLGSGFRANRQGRNSKTQGHPGSASYSARSNGSDPAGNQLGRPSGTQGSLRYQTPRVMIGSTTKMSAAFDTLEATHRLEDAGMDRRQAEAVATIVGDGQGDLATKDDIGNLVTTGDLYRALVIQATGIIAAFAALACIAIGLASLWSGQ